MIRHIQFRGHQLLFRHFWSHPSITVFFLYWKPCKVALQKSMVSAQVVAPYATCSSFTTKSRLLDRKARTRGRGGVIGWGPKAGDYFEAIWQFDGKCMIYDIYIYDICKHCSKYIVHRLSFLEMAGWLTPSSTGGSCKWASGRSPRLWISLKSSWFWVAHVQSQAIAWRRASPTRHQICATIVPSHPVCLGTGGWFGRLVVEPLNRICGNPHDIASGARYHCTMTSIRWTLNIFIVPWSATKQGSHPAQSCFDDCIWLLYSI